MVLVHNRSYVVDWSRKENKYQCCLMELNLTQNIVKYFKYNSYKWTENGQKLHLEHMKYPNKIGNIKNLCLIIMCKNLNFCKNLPTYNN